MGEELSPLKSTFQEGTFKKEKDKFFAVLFARVSRITKDGTSKERIDLFKTEVKKL